MSITINEQLFSTTELALAAALSLHLSIVDIDRSNPRRAIFRFEKSDELENVVADYWSDSLRVSPKEYFYQLRHLKSRLYEAGGQV